MSSRNDDLTADEIDVLRQIGEARALIRLSKYFSRPYIDFLRQLLVEHRVSRAELAKVALAVGSRFDELATEVPEIRDHKSVLAEEVGPN